MKFNIFILSLFFIVLTRRISLIKKLFLIMTIVIFLFIISLIFFLFYGKSETLNLTINDINLSSINDGMYIGQYVKGRFNYKVEVIIKNHKIESIKILNQKSSYLNTNEIIIKRVLEKQSLNVDTVSGATATSKGILKAIEKALKNNN